MEKYLISSLRFDVPDEPEVSRWARLPSGVRTTVGICVPLLVLGGIVAGAATMTAPTPKPQFIAAESGAPAVAALTDAPAVAALTDDPAAGAPTGDTAGAGAAAGEPARSVPAPPTAKAPVVKRVRPRPDPATRLATSHRPAQPSPVAEIPAATRAAAARPKTVPAAVMPVKPVTTTQAQTDVRRIAFSTRFVHDPALPLGVQRVRSSGAAGERTLRYVVTLTNGHQTGRRLLSSTVTRNPRQRIVALGQKRRDHVDVQWPGTWPGQPDSDEDDGQCDVLCLPWERGSADPDAARLPSELLSERFQVGALDDPFPDR